MGITKTVNVETTNARASTTLTDTTPTVPLPDTPQGLMVIGPQVTLHFVEGEWDEANTYDYYDVVQVDGTSYIAVQDVPAGTEITNTEYWAKWNDPNAQVKLLQDTVNGFDGRINQNTTNINMLTKLLQDTVNGFDGRITQNTNDINMLKGRGLNLIPVEAYGAKGDSTTDDTEAINAVLTAGFTPYLSAGKKYLISAPIELNGEQTIYCDGYLLASQSFNGLAMVIIGRRTTVSDNVLSMPTALYYKIKVDCNWANCDGVYVSSSFGNTFDCVIKNFNSKGLYTGYSQESGYILQTAENIYTVHCDNGSSDVAKTKTQTVGIYMRAHDDIYNAITAANIVTAVDMNTYNYFNYVHSWITFDELFTGSSVIKSTNGKYVAGEIYCDGVETALNLIGASAGSKAYIRINPEPQNERKTVKPFKYVGGNYSDGPYNDADYYVSTIDNSPIVINASDYEAGFMFSRVNGNNIEWVSDNGSIGKLFQTDGVAVGSVANPSGLTAAYLPSGTTPSTFFIATCTRRKTAEPLALITMAEQHHNIYSICGISKGDDTTTNFVTANWKAQ